ncbi:MAG: putative FAD-linked oxidoreductase [Syntrophorhabdaceae bacterium PtaU1.Bin034]|nr:MAG: putative FAD-linked oxidoreductase [Syntrophorhabdaceae bacterium PtaU1.Bin034]
MSVDEVDFRKTAHQKINKFLDEVKKVLKGDRIITDHEGLSHFGYDATEMRFMPDVVVQPESTEQVSKILRLAYSIGIPVTPQGGRTGLSGGGLPVQAGTVLSLLRMNRILEIDRKNMQIVVEPGVIPADLQKTLNGHNLFFPPDPSSTVESTIGGNVAENAGYTRAVKYGVTRDYVIGLEAVLPDGDVINVGGRTVKNVAGYDLVALLTGSEGTLAVVTKIILKVLPRPAFRRTCLFYFEDLVTAADLIVAIFRNGIIPCAAEIMDNTAINCVADYLNVSVRRDAAVLVLVEVDGNHRAATEEEASHILTTGNRLSGLIEARLAADDEEADRFWRIRRETLPALKAKGRDHLEADVVVPRFRLPYLARAIKEIASGRKISVATYGHAGDGNLHVTIMYRKRNFAELEEAYELLEDIYKKTLEMDGKLTGEHGVGLTVKNYLDMQMSEAEIALMRRIKEAFDPKGFLNPGKIFPDKVEKEEPCA